MSDIAEALVIVFMNQYVWTVLLGVAFYTVLCGLSKFIKAIAEYKKGTEK